MRLRFGAVATSALLIANFPLAGASCKGEPMPQINQVDPMNGATYPAIEKAVARLRERGLKVEDYKIEVVRKDDNCIVMFVDPHRDPGMRGASGKPGFEVELTPDLAIVRDNFIR